MLSSALVIALIVASCTRKEPTQAAGGPQAMPVQVKTATLQSVDDTTEYVATLKSRDSAVVMPQVEGIITQIFVRSGDRVENGAQTLIIRLRIGFK